MNRNRGKSFAERLRAGENKEELMKYYCMNEQEYERAVACVERIRLHGRI